MSIVWRGVDGWSPTIGRVIPGVEVYLTEEQQKAFASDIEILEDKTKKDDKIKKEKSGGEK